MTKQAVPEPNPPSSATTSGSSEPGPESGDKKEPIDQELGELLEELRVAIPGVEVLFAFLLGVAFTQRFETLTSLQRTVYFGTLLAAAGATALLIAPSAFHRLRFREEVKPEILSSATRLVIASLVLILLAVAGVVLLVADLLYSLQFASFAVAVVAGWFVWFWFLLPVWRTRNRS